MNPKSEGHPNHHDVAVLITRCVRIQGLCRVVSACNYVLFNSLLTVETGRDECYEYKSVNRHTDRRQ